MFLAYTYLTDERVCLHCTLSSLIYRRTVSRGVLPMLEPSETSATFIIYVQVFVKIFSFIYETNKRLLLYTISNLTFNGKE